MGACRSLPAQARRRREMAAVAVPQEIKPREARRGLRYVIALLQAFGGAYGLYVVLRLVSGPDHEGLFASSTTVALLLLVSALYVLSLLAGVALWLRPSAGVGLSIVNQLTQLIELEVPRLTYRFVSGAVFLVRVMVGTEGEKIQFGSSFSFELLTSGFLIFFGKPGTTVSISVNLLALAILVWLWRYRRARAG